MALGSNGVIGMSASINRNLLVMYYYAWRNNEKRLTMYGRECEVIARGKMNSIMIRFTDNGQREIVSRNSVRKKKVTNQLSLRY